MFPVELGFMGWETLGFVALDVLGELEIGALLLKLDKVLAEVGLLIGIPKPKLFSLLAAGFPLKLETTTA